MWKPPTQLAYLWHLGRDRARRHRGGDPLPRPGRRLPPGSRSSTAAGSGWEGSGEQWRDRNRAGWQTLLPHFLAAISKGDSAMNAGTKEDPWVLKTPPGTSAYTMYKDEQADPPALVCQVGSTTLKYHLRAIDDLHAWLAEQGDWVSLGAADEKKPAAPGTVEAWGQIPGQPCRRLVRPAQRLPWPVRHVPAAAAGSTRPRRSHPRPPQQPDASDTRCMNAGGIAGKNGDDS